MDFMLPSKLVLCNKININNVDTKVMSTIRMGTKLHTCKLQLDYKNGKTMESFKFSFFSKLSLFCITFINYKTHV